MRSRTRWSVSEYTMCFPSRLRRTKLSERSTPRLLMTTVRADAGLASAELIRDRWSRPHVVIVTLHLKCSKPKPFATFSVFSAARQWISRMATTPVTAISIPTHRDSSPDECRSPSSGDRRWLNMILGSGVIGHCPSVLQYQGTEVTAALVYHWSMPGNRRRKAIFPLLLP
jgi:hypothetical protein